MNQPVRIGIVGDFNPEYRSHHAINASLQHSAEALSLPLQPEWVPTSGLEAGADTVLRDFDGLFIASGSPYRSMQGAFQAIQFGRTQLRPLLAT